MILTGGLALCSAAAPAGTLAVNMAAACTGTSGLEVSTTLTCAAPDNLTIDAPPMIQGTYTACDHLVAESVEVVPPGATFQAELSVTLSEGFSVGAGAGLTIESGSPPLSPFGFVTDESPAAATTYRALYQISVDPLSLGAGDELANLVGSSAEGAPHLQVVLTNSGGADRVFVRARLDDGSFVDGLATALMAGCNSVEVRWTAGAGNGSLVMAVNGSAFTGPINLDNDQARIDRVRWGAVAGSLATTSGSFYLDEFESSL